ncbi:hypothetical protein DIPPA_20636 [Diplonema papillatum]|nr:hypothetical protein DIPPA_20636 [Diplonema papillatum]
MRVEAVGVQGAGRLRLAGGVSRFEGGFVVRLLPATAQVDSAHHIRPATVGLAEAATAAAIAAASSAARAGVRQVPHCVSRCAQQHWDAQAVVCCVVVQQQRQQ